MVAASFIPEGTLIGAVPPQAIVCYNTHRTKRCGKCLAPTSRNNVNENGNQGGPATVACEGCCEIWYCDERCRVQDWNTVHKYECKFLKYLHNGNDQEGNQQQNHDYERSIEKFREMDDYEKDYCRLMIRILIHRFKEYLSPQSEASPRPREQEPDDDEPQPFSDVLDLVENRSSFSKELIEGSFLNVARILDAFQTFLEQNSREIQKCSGSQLDDSLLKGVGEEREEGEGIPRLTLDELMGIIIKEECNSVGLYEYWPTIAATPAATSTSNSRIGYALGLYIQHCVHSFNHSCTPNLYHVASKDRQLFYAARDISQGEELNLKYLEFAPEYRIPNAEQRRQEREHSSAKELERKVAFEKRRAYLKQIFHFDCACERCAWEFSMDWGSSQPEVNREEEEEERKEDGKFLREGLVCERDGCHGFYAPPVVLGLMRENTTSYAERQLQLQETEAEIERWGCVACGRQRG